MNNQNRLPIRSLQALVGVIAFALWAMPALADVVHMKNGDRLTGKVDSIDGKQVMLKTDYAGMVTLELESVLTVETEDALDLKLRDGEKQQARLVAKDDSQLIVVPDAEPSQLPLADLRSASRNNSTFANLGREWTTRVDLLASVSTGNSETEAYNGIVESKLKRDRSEHSVMFRNSQEEADGVTTKDQLDFNYGYKRFFSEKWFGSGVAEYSQDELKDVDYRITAGAGLGYQFWDNSFGALAAEVGGNVVVEELDGMREENPAARWALQYNRHLWGKRLELFHNHSLLVIFDRGEVIKASTGLRMAVNHRIDTNVRVDLEHDTEPTVDNVKTDVTYAVGVGIKF